MREGRGGSERGNWLACLGVGCLVVLVAFGIAGYYAYVAGMRAMRSAAATGVRAGAREIVKDLRFPDAERVAVLEPVNRFAKKIEAGEVSLEQGVAVAQALTEGPALAAVMSRGFYYKYIEGSDLPEEKKEAARLAARRFAWGVTRDRIDDREAEDIYRQLTVPSPTGGANNNQNRQFRDTIPDEELMKLVGKMKTAADEAEVPVAVSAVDIAAELQKAIERGMATPSGAAPGGTTGTTDGTGAS